ncbi:hypothetical protein C8A03DRAFT_11173 [Achaetomium macrosporum]|uniref:Aminoglycoside phosphotransferase domain-containing protein n=1 Tax=Achaetomium macrosporum TaxID=79813 RepID=A0AAN7CIV9_9PEZI|nr:hypothetical protein C8A03DRAFT_11173 [Achaetomium macrosporum]
MDDETERPRNTQTESSSRLDFFSRNHLPQTARSQCWRFAQSLHPSSPVLEPPCQGHCSYTLLLPDHKTIIQFRPPKHRLDLEITSAAHAIFGTLAPHTQLLGAITFAMSSPEHDNSNNNNNKNNNPSLIVYSHSLIEGTPLPSILSAHPEYPPSHPEPSLPSLNLEPLLTSLATSYFARSYTASLPSTSPLLAQLKRRVGQTLRQRLALLRAHLPARFRPVVEDVAGVFGELEAGLPWALTHGDLCGAGVGNVFVQLRGRGRLLQDQEGGVDVELNGLIDWAEGEYLPFGVGLYGVEEVLGRMVDVPVKGGGEGDKRRRFEYHPCAGRLREVFWEELEAAVPALVEDKVLRKRVEKARLLGLLLWYGIAFDDGALDRVVCPGRDDEELQKLDLFLLGANHGGDTDTALIPEEDDASDKDSGCAFNNECDDAYAENLDCYSDSRNEAEGACPVPGKL